MEKKSTGVTRSNGQWPKLLRAGGKSLLIVKKVIAKMQAYSEGGLEVYALANGLNNNFNDENHLFHYFKKRVGIIPSQWRFHSLHNLNAQPGAAGSVHAGLQLGNLLLLGGAAFLGPSQDIDPVAGEM